MVESLRLQVSNNLKNLKSEAAETPKNHHNINSIQSSKIHFSELLET